MNAKRCESRRRWRSSTNVTKLRSIRRLHQPMINNNLQHLLKISNNSIKMAVDLLRVRIWIRDSRGAEEAGLSRDGNITSRTADREEGLDPAREIIAISKITKKTVTILKIIIDSTIMTEEVAKEDLINTKIMDENTITREALPLIIEALTINIDSSKIETKETSISSSSTGMDHPMAVISIIRKMIHTMMRVATKMVAGIKMIEGNNHHKGISLVLDPITNK